MNNSERIKNAVENIKSMIPTYWEATVRSRTPGTSNGSVFDFQNVEKVLFEDRLHDWEEYKDCPNLMTGCTAYVLRDVSGRLGVIELVKLDPMTVLDVIDNKKTGKAKLIAHVDIGPETDVATLILGEDQGREVVFTFHPGLPVRPDEIPVEKLGGRITVTVSEAINLGFTHACIA